MLDGSLEESVLVRSKQPCPDCGSSDALHIYTDHTWCYSCETRRTDHPEIPEPGAKPGGVSKSELRKVDLLETTPFSKVLRGISPDVLRKFGYSTGTYYGERVHIAPYRNAQGEIAAQHLRKAQKVAFPWVGDKTDVQLFGQHLWTHNTAKSMLVVTEGEIDAMSVAQAQGAKYPVVSISSGVSGAAKDIARNLDWVERFEDVVFLFDMDEPGQSAALKCAKLLSPGKARIASLPMKDANEMLQAKRGKELIEGIWNAKDWRPDGMVKLSEVRSKAEAPTTLGMQWWCPSLTLNTYGRRFGEIITLGAGTGVGKTDFLIQQVLHDATIEKHPLGIFFLEQQPEETARRLAGKMMGQPFHLPKHPLKIADCGTVFEDLDAPPLWTDEGLKQGLDAVDGLPIFGYDHFGVADWTEIENRMRHLVHAEGVRNFFIDHLTALADPSDEKGSLERIMGELGSLVKELDVLVHLVSHLTTAEGTPHEEGGRVKIRHFKGSRAIGFWSHTMLGLERDQQAEEEDVRKTTTVRLLKHRQTGRFLGKTFELSFNDETGRLFEKTSELVDENSGEEIF